MDTVEEILKKWDFFDQAITRHGFVEYNRDYRLEVTIVGADGIEHPMVYLFRACMEAHYENVIVSPGLKTVLDDTYIDYGVWESAGAPDGFVWGVNWALAYPGWRLVADSQRAMAWSRKLQLSMREIEVTTNTYRLNLVFHDVTIQPGNSR